MAAETALPTSHPKGFWFIFFGELAERCSFYGMRVLLTMYLVTVFQYSKHDAFMVMHLYMAACFFAPLLGGFIADRFLGKYWTIVAFSVPYVAGQFLVDGCDEFNFSAACEGILKSQLLSPFQGLSGLAGN